MSAVVGITVEKGPGGFIAVKDEISFVVRRLGNFPKELRGRFFAARDVLITPRSPEMIHVLRLTL